MRIEDQYPSNPQSNIMKMRVRKVANFLAFNLLFFALYLNFIQQDKQAVLNVDHSLPAATAAFSGTILVEHPEKFVDQQSSTATELPGRSVKPQAIKRSVN